MYNNSTGKVNKFNGYVEVFFNYHKNITIFVCGDFNINLLSHCQHYLADNLFSILHSYGLHVLITK